MATGTLTGGGVGSVGAIEQRRSGKTFGAQLFVKDFPRFAEVQEVNIGAHSRFEAVCPAGRSFSFQPSAHTMHRCPFHVLHVA